MSACEKQCLFGLPQCWLYIWDARSLKISQDSQLGNPQNLQEPEALRNFSCVLGWRPCGVLGRPELRPCTVLCEGREVRGHLPLLPNPALPYDVIPHLSTLNWWPSYLSVGSHRHSSHFADQKIVLCMYFPRAVPLFWITITK